MNVAMFGRASAKLTGSHGHDAQCLETVVPKLCKWPRFAFTPSFFCSLFFLFCLSLSLYLSPSSYPLLLFVPSVGIDLYIEIIEIAHLATDILHCAKEAELKGMLIMPVLVDLKAKDIVEWGGLSMQFVNKRLCIIPHVCRLKFCDRELEIGTRCLLDPSFGFE